MDIEKPSETIEIKNDHAEAIEFVEKNRDLFEHYARGGVKFAPAPEGLNTFAFNLVTKEIYINNRFYKERGLSDEKTTYGVLHETEHLLEDTQLLSEKDGERVFSRYLKDKEDKAFSLMDNCVADVRENRAVVSKTHKGFKEIEGKLYEDDLFTDTDFTKEPLHIQLPQALLAEAHISGKKCNIDTEVRKKLDTFLNITGKDGTKLFDVMTNPATPMSVRLKLQDKFLWPIIKELREKDIEDEKKKREAEEEENEEGSGKDGDVKENKEDKERGNDGKKEGERDKKESKENDKGKSKEGEGEKRGKKNKSKNSQSGNKEGKIEKPDPNEIFKEAYARAEKKVPNATPLEEIKKAFEEWEKENRENKEDKADKEYAEKLGVKKEDLQKYREIVKSLNNIVNPETNETLIEELRALISRIIAKRLKPALAPRYPMIEGEDLVDPAQLIADVKSGNLEPKVWETWEIKEKKGKRFGEVEITFIFDRSGSMDDGDGQKKIEQRKAGVLGMEALKEFADICDEERVNMEKPLEVRSEVYSFQSDSNDSKPLKNMSKELGEKERVDICGTLSTTSGSTTDYIPLETIFAGIDDEMKKKITEGEVKKIVIVFTDGGSDDPARVQVALENLHEVGVIIVCIAITESGRPALETYKPDAKLAETAEKLPLVLGDLLKEHLADL